jgi:hypothetical protein
VEKSAIADQVQEKDIFQSYRKKRVNYNTQGEKKVVIKVEGGPTTEGRGRAAVDALNRQIKEEVTGGSSYRYVYTGRYRPLVSYLFVAIDDDH